MARSLLLIAVALLIGGGCWLLLAASETRDGEGTRRAGDVHVTSTRTPSTKGRTKSEGQGFSNSETAERRSSSLTHTASPSSSHVDKGRRAHRSSPSSLEVDVSIFDDDVELILKELTTTSVFSSESQEDKTSNEGGNRLVVGSFSLQQEPPTKSLKSVAAGLLRLVATTFYQESLAMKERKLRRGPGGDQQRQQRPILLCFIFYCFDSSGGGAASFKQLNSIVQSKVQLMAKTTTAKEQNLSIRVHILPASLQVVSSTSASKSGQRTFSHDQLTRSGTATLWNSLKRRYLEDELKKEKKVRSGGDARSGWAQEVTQHLSLLARKTQIAVILQNPLSTVVQESLFNHRGDADADQCVLLKQRTGKRDEEVVNTPESVPVVRKGTLSAVAVSFLNPDSVPQICQGSTVFDFQTDSQKQQDESGGDLKFKAVFDANGRLAEVAEGSRSGLPRYISLVTNLDSCGPSVAGGAPDRPRKFLHLEKNRRPGSPAGGGSGDSTHLQGMIKIDTSSRSSSSLWTCDQILHPPYLNPMWYHEDHHHQD